MIHTYKEYHDDIMVHGQKYANTNMVRFCKCIISQKKFKNINISVFPTITVCYGIVIGIIKASAND